MEKLKKYLTPKATGWLAIGMGGGALLCWIALGIVYGSIKSYFTSFGANENGLGLMVILLIALMLAFFVSLLATLVSGAGNGIRLFAWKDRRPFTIAAFAVACLNLVLLQPLLRQCLWGFGQRGQPDHHPLAAAGAVAVRHVLADCPRRLPGIFDGLGEKAPGCRPGL